MKIEIKWTDISDDDSHHLWNAKYVLYAYFHPEKDKLLYIGKCLSTTVKCRWQGKDKLIGFWKQLKDEGIHEHSIAVGELKIKDKHEFTDILLKDIESLLIFSLRPWGNIQCVNSIILSHKLKIFCKGDWYHNLNYFANYFDKK
ncbi:MAG TPA: hypothetical protein DCY06_09915 [Bacteroidetes bacterium]|nr:hypothetical protein [Bacteroidota bacterium]HRE12416.1 hypothetical protein [Ignavibacteria bacterium]HRF65844.1 hypothetical protein [Ignavibacteria bacterium]